MFTEIIPSLAAPLEMPSEKKDPILHQSFDKMHPKHRAQRNLMGNFPSGADGFALGLCRRIPPNFKEKLNPYETLQESPPQNLLCQESFVPWEIVV